MLVRFLTTKQCIDSCIRRNDVVSDHQRPPLDEAQPCLPNRQRNSGISLLVVNIRTSIKYFEISLFYLTFFLLTYRWSSIHTSFFLSWHWWSSIFTILFLPTYRWGLIYTSFFLPFDRLGLIYPIFFLSFDRLKSIVIIDVRWRHQMGRGISIS